MNLKNKLSIATLQESFYSSWKILLVILILIILVLHYYQANKIFPDGILVPEQPKQILISRPQAWVKKDYVITPLATYAIRARILHTKTYWFGREADLSPIDLVLGWSVMSDERNLKKISIRQSDRYYFWGYHRPIPITNEDIINNSSNVHILPANKKVTQQIDSLHANNIVTLRGYLVNVKGKDGYTWNSSLSRTDTGAGSCEVFWVESVNVEH